MKDGWNAAAGEAPQLFFKQYAVHIAFRPGMRNRCDELNSLFHSLLRIFDPSRAEQHHLTAHLAQITAGKRVIADESTTVRRQMLSTKCKEPITNRLGHPCIKSVGNDVVEFAQLRANVEHIGLKKPDVTQAK